VNHHRAGRLLSAYVDSELTAAEARAVQEHLLDCAPCRDAYENLRAARDLLAGLPPAEPPAEFWAAIRGPMMRASAAHGGSEGWTAGATPEQVDAEEYGCGCFWFQRSP